MLSDIFRIINNEIFIVNIDLQQVSYKLQFKFVSYIHLYAVYIIWNKFE